MDDISEFFKNAKRIKKPPLGWWENPKQKYTVIYANVDERSRWHRTHLWPDEPILCPTCSRFDHWKVGGHSTALVMVCEHEPIAIGVLGVRNVVTIPIRFIHLRYFKCRNCGNQFDRCECTEMCFDADLIDKT